MTRPSLVVGLGNPGPSYVNTPHNLGFEALVRFGTRLRASTPIHRWDAMVSEARFKGETVFLAWPQTFMNCSGEPVAKILKAKGLDPKDLLVIVDDLDLPLGSLRLRPSGGTGGHHGLDSLLSELGTNSFARLRMGVGLNVPKEEVVDFLLTPFPEKILPEISGFVDRAATGLMDVMALGFKKAMSNLNRLENERMKEEDTQ